MLGYIFKSLLKRQTRNVLLLVGLLSLSSGLSTFVSANQDAKVKIRTTIDEHWRGAFDILVRPTYAVQPTERQYGLVESNYLSVGKSGISVQQWKQIEKLSGVEVAAPVATIGYLRNASGAITVQIPPQNETSFYRVSVAISSTNGYRMTQVANLNQYFVVKPRGPSATDGATTNPPAKRETNILLTTVDKYGEPDSAAVQAGIMSPPDAWTLVAGIDPDAESKLSGLDKAVVNGQYLKSNDGFSTEKVPDPRTTNYTDAQGHVDQQRRDMDFRNYAINPDGPNIPIIFATTTYISLPIRIQADKLKMLDESTIQALKTTSTKEAFTPDGRLLQKPTDLLRAQLDKLNSPVSQRLVDRTFDFGDVLKPMAPSPLNISLYPNQSSIQITPGFRQTASKGIEKAYRPGAVSYLPQPAPFDTGGVLSLAAQPKFDAQTIITNTGEVAFRSLPLAPPVMASAPSSSGGQGNFRSPFSFNEIGSYSFDKLPASVKNPDPLTYVPLGIYQPPLVTLVRDAGGNPLPGGPVPLRPTINPASFIPGPPLALTNIAAARFFRGDNAIDAIRVRVGGIDRYTPENVQKVADVAAQIIKSTGLRVDIVAGSSPQKVLVYIPGSPDGTVAVAPLGYVEEQWTTLGAAAAITSGIDEASVLMLGGTGVAGLLYLVSQSLLSTLARRRELALLGAVGWRRGHISSLVVGEAAVVGLLGGLCATVLAMLLAAGLGLAAPVEQAAGIGLAVLLLYVFASVGPAVWVVRQPVAALLQRGEVALPAVGTTRVRAGAQPKEEPPSDAVTRAAGKGWTGVRGVAVFAWRTLYSRRARSLLAGGSLAVATLLLTLISVSLASLGGTLRVTLLGQYVGLQVQPYHLVMVGSAVIMSVLAVGDHLAMGVLERKQELALLQAVGWRSGSVRVSILIEGLWLGLIGGAAGGLTATAILLVSNASLLLSGWWVVPLSVATMLGLCGLSALYAISLTARQSLVRAMQQ